ncbi:hypothetical protein B0H14DRAFT_3478751 [Mycena olivaceomarginata]|nr:hypothetical protein B0H14DRAFT_3478751 [Mycena olivaceomarginata]
MSRKTKSTPASLPLARPSAATTALSKDASPATKSVAVYGEHLAADHPDTKYWLPFDNIVSHDLVRYFDSNALPTNDATDFFNTLMQVRLCFEGHRTMFPQPPLEVERFLYTIYKVASAVATKFPKPFEFPKVNPHHDLSFYLRLKSSPEVMTGSGARIALDASFFPKSMSTPPRRRLRLTTHAHSTVQSIRSARRDGGAAEGDPGRKEKRKTDGDGRRRAENALRTCGHLAPAAVCMLGGLGRARSPRCTLGRRRLGKRVAGGGHKGTLFRERREPTKARKNKYGMEWVSTLPDWCFEIARGMEASSSCTSLTGASSDFTAPPCAAQ